MYIGVVFLFVIQSEQTDLKPLKLNKMDEAKKLIIEYMIFEDSARSHAYSPHLGLCFDSKKEATAIKALKTGIKLQFDYWRKKKVLVEKIDILGLESSTSDVRKDSINRGINIPYSIFLNKSSRVRKMEVRIKV